MNPVSRRDLWRILYQLLREKVTILIATAYLDEAERCSRVGLIHRGDLLTVGVPEEVKKLMRGTILEVRSSEARRAARILRKRACGALRFDASSQPWRVCSSLCWLGREACCHECRQER